jgi:hypothetical protein
LKRTRRYSTVRVCPEPGTRYSTGTVQVPVPGYCTVQYPVPVQYCTVALPVPGYPAPAPGTVISPIFKLLESDPSPLLLYPPTHPHVTDGRARQT